MHRPVCCTYRSIDTFSQYRILCLIFPLLSTPGMYTGAFVVTRSSQYVLLHAKRAHDNHNQNNSNNHNNNNNTCVQRRKFHVVTHILLGDNHFALALNCINKVYAYLRRVPMKQKQPLLPLWAIRAGSTENRSKLRIDRFGVMLCVMCDEKEYIQAIEVRRPRLRHWWTRDLHLNSHIRRTTYML